MTTFEEFIRSLAGWSDHNLAKDFHDSVLPAADAPTAALLTRYYGLRRHAPHWRPDHVPAVRHSNHREIDPALLDALLRGEEAKTCHQCGKPFTPQRKSARYCSNACRVRAHRAKAPEAEKRNSKAAKGQVRSTQNTGVGTTGRGRPLSVSGGVL